MKLSVSISDEVADLLETVVRGKSGINPSIVTDLALRRLLGLPPEEFAELVRRHQFDRKAATRNGWAEAFWHVLGSAMGRDDRIDNPYAARHYGPFYIVLLMNRAQQQDEEADPFPIHMATQMWTQESPPPSRWIFDRSKSPVRAAEEVAEKLRELGVSATS